MILMLQGEILANFVTTCSMELCALFPRAPRICDASYGGKTLDILFLWQGQTLAIRFAFFLFSALSIVRAPRTCDTS